jgi:hypothetical protein
MGFTAILPYAAQAGQTAKVTMKVYDILGQTICGSSVTVVVDPICGGNAALVQSGFGVKGNSEPAVQPE